MKWDVVLAAVLAGLAIYTMRRSYTFINSNVYLPKDRRRWLFFDKVNFRHPNLFRIIASISATLGITLFGHGVSFWIVVAPVFLISVNIYFFTLLRSYILLKGGFAEYYED